MYENQSGEFVFDNEASWFKLTLFSLSLGSGSIFVSLCK